MKPLFLPLALLIGLLALAACAAQEKATPWHQRRPGWAGRLGLM